MTLKTLYYTIMTQYVQTARDYHREHVRTGIKVYKALAATKIKQARNAKTMMQKAGA